MQPPMPYDVLHILGTAQPEGMGIARIVSDLARGLDPEHYRTHACFLGGHGPLVSVIEKAGAKVTSLTWVNGARDAAGAWRFWRHLRRRKFDIVHVHFGGRSVLWLARAATHGKIVLHLHGTIDESQGVRSMPPSGRGADAVVAVSRAVAKWAVGTKARVIYPGVAELQADGQEVVAPGSASGNVLGTAGRLAKVKGIADLIRAMAALRGEIPGTRLEIAGSGPEQISLEADVRNLGLEDSVRFLGWRSDLQSVFAGWDIFVQPSHDEGFPVATIEAMVAGLPVVATAVGGLPELVQNETTGLLVPPGDPEALAARLRALLLDSPKRQAMGAAGRIRVAEHFSARQMVERISEVYDGLLSNRGETHVESASR